MADIKEFPTAETQGFINRKRQGRPKSDDPKVSVTLSLRRSTVARISDQLTGDQTVAGALSAAVEAKYGARDVDPRPKAKK